MSGKRFPLDLSAFKKVHEDRDSATLMHPGGHKIQISKTGLNKKLRSQLAELPNHMDEGGEVEEALAPMAPAMDPGGNAIIPEQNGLVRPIVGGQPMQIAAPQTLANMEYSESTKPAEQIAPTNYSLGTNRVPTASPIVAANLAQTDAYQQGFGTTEKGIQQEAAAQGALGKLEAQAADEHAQKVQNLMAEHQKQYQVLDQEIQNTIKDIDTKHIDADHYINDKSTLGKISTAIGLILGGIGGGLTHQENPALKFLNSQIDRDIEVQKSNLGKKNNILNAYYHQMGNLNDATAMTKAFYVDLYSNQIKKAAALSQSPLAQSKSMQAIGQLKVQKTQILGPIALKNAVMNGMQSGNSSPEMAIKMLAPEGQQQHLYKDLEAMQNLSAGRDHALEVFDKLIPITAYGNRITQPFESRKQINALKGPLTAALSKETAGRFTEQDAKYLDSLWPTAGDADKTLNEKRSEINRLLSEKMHFPSLTPYGIRPPASRPQANPNNIPGYGRK